MTVVEEVFGEGCDLLKVADSMMDGIETYSVNGETGETESEESVWDWIATKQSTITFDAEMIQ